MRYMIIVKMTEPSPPPSSEMLAAMGKLNEEMIAAGVLLAAEGLQPSRSGAKVRMQNGKLEVRDGPFAEAKELIGGYAVLEAPSKEAAIALGAEFVQLHIDHGMPDITVEVRQIDGGYNY